MNELYLKTFFPGVVLIFVLSCVTFAQKKPEPVIIKKVGYLKTRDKQLERAISKSNEANSVEEFRYHYNKVDLNSDGNLDAIVFDSSENACGTGGCDMLIYKGTGKGYQLLTQMSVSRPPLIVLSTKTRGWNDLVMRVSGGGIKPYFSLLKFDGKSYPKNPTVGAEIPRKGQIKGVEYLSGIERYDTGFSLK